MSALEELSTALFPFWFVPVGNQKIRQESQGTAKRPGWDERRNLQLNSQLGTGFLNVSPGESRSTGLSLLTDNFDEPLRLAITVTTAQYQVVLASQIADHKLFMEQMVNGLFPAQVLPVATVLQGSTMFPSPGCCRDS